MRLIVQLLSKCQHYLQPKPHLSVAQDPDPAGHPLQDQDLALLTGAA